MHLHKVTCKSRPKMGHGCDPGAGPAVLAGDPGALRPKAGPVVLVGDSGGLQPKRQAQWC